MRKDDLPVVRVFDNNTDDAARILRARLEASELFRDLRFRREGVTRAGRRKLRSRYIQHLRKQKEKRRARS